MLHDVSGDDVDLNITQDFSYLIGDSPKTPQNIVKLKYDPRSPADYERTPIKIALDNAD